MVIVVANRIPIAKGWEEEFEKRWRNRKWSITELPGFIRNEILRPIRGDHYIVKTYWESMEDFQRWTKSKAFEEAHKDSPPSEAFAGENSLEIHEVISSVGSPESPG